MLSLGLIFRVVIPLNLVKLDSLISSDSILLIQNVNGMCLVGQVWLQWDGVFNYNISWGLQKSIKLLDMKHIVHSR
jgi:hypothetical protein